MSEELNRLHDLVGALARRERALLLWQSALRSAALLAAILVGACVAAWQDVPRPTAVAGLILLGGVGAWFLVGAPWVARWRRAGDPIRQARLLEALDPSLRGRLITAVARRGGARGAESPELLG